MPSPSSLKWRLISTFFLLLLLHCLAIFLFTRGFLLTRTELPNTSTCSDVLQSPCHHHISSHIDGANSTHSCWTKPSIDRLVIIVLDALRFDFVAPSTSFQEKKPWMDRLPVLQKLASDPGSSARIFKAIADPPTTSLQRLKGLTTGGLPTFIDVGNSFGAPVIVEDNLIQQLVQSGKRVVMMGDDTWLQLFPHHFERSFPYPSFNVKDLDTVDNGCVEHLLPTLNEGNWDVLIAHFLGVDHAGHIFGVNTMPMVQKLEQYNVILETVIGALKAHSEPGGLHENTFLIVMGDHGQTLNGDHGGGSPEEIETSIFSMSFKKPTFSVPSDLGMSNCGFNTDGKEICIGTIDQLDFAVTISAMLGVPFPFGSIGRVNSLLYSLPARSRFPDGTETDGLKDSLEQWMQHYVKSLCINAWQVKRYIDVYSGSSVLGFAYEDLLHVDDLYLQAQAHWSLAIEDLLTSEPETNVSSFPVLMRQVDAYLKFLDGVIELARSKWTEFDLKMMGVGLSILFLSLLIQLIAVGRFDKLCCSFSLPSVHIKVSVASIFALLLVVIRACSFLSNSYILEEGKVAIFLLGTAGMLDLRYSISKMFISEATSSFLLVYIVRFSVEYGLSKQASYSSGFASTLGIPLHHPAWVSLSLVGPILAMLVLVYLLLKFVTCRSDLGDRKYVIYGTVLCYTLIIVHWVVESNLLNMPSLLQRIGRISIPRFIYAVGILQLASVVVVRQVYTKTYDNHRVIIHKTVTMLSACSSTVLLLSGKQGSLVALATIAGAWCIMRLGNLSTVPEGAIGYNITHLPLPVTKWSLLAVCLFFCTGHWCAFDGLRYAAAFAGFDEFIFVRQAILLAIETFGFSHILPVFGLPVLVAYRLPNDGGKQTKSLIFARLALVYMIYGFITAFTVTFTVLCVTIHRRHLMVWGLFAPKYVFDALGLILTDILICLALLYYIDPAESENAE